MKKLKGIKHEKEFDTMTIATDMSELQGAEELLASADHSTKETVDRKTLSDTQKNLAEGKPTQVYEPRPLTPDDDIYEDIIEQFASAPTKPKYWFEEFGDYWSCSCGHINKGDHCKSCGLERELLRSLFILHKPAGETGKLNKKLKKSKEQADKEAEQYADRESRRKEREASGEDLTKVVPIETDCKSDTNTSPHEDAVPVSSPPAYKEVHIPKETCLTVPAKKLNFNKKNIIAIAVCIVLIALGGIAIYKHMAAPAMQYEEALQLMEDGKYELAIEKYTALGDYKDSADMIHQCWILLGDKHYENKEYKEAITAYNTALDLKEDDSLHEKIRKCYIGIGDKYLKDKAYEKALGAYAVAAEIAAGEDVQKKIDNAKFGYVKAFMSDRTEQVEKYMDELMESDYPGIQEVYDQYYAWHTSIVANTSETDYSTDVDAVSRKDTIYFHVSLSGGEPSEKIHLFYEIKWPEGHTEIYDLGADWKAGDKIAARFQYPIPLFGKEGKMIFSLYDMNTRELLGSDSVTFKN